MKNPTPIDQLPSFLEHVRAAQDPVNRYMPFVIIGGLILAALFIADRITQTPIQTNAQPKLTNKRHERY